MLKIFTDGSSKGNPGAGGYSFVVMNENQDYIYHKFLQQEEYITNNQAELKAIINALNFLNNNLLENSEYIIYSDSAYCVNICNDWIYKWKRNNWKRAKNKPIENLDLILTLYELLTTIKVNFKIVKTEGHSNIIGNEIADALATNDFNKFTKIIEKYKILY